MPTLFFTSKHWKEALIGACLSSNITALLSVAQAGNLISPNCHILPSGLGGLVGLATEVAYNGSDFSVQGQLLGGISLFLNYMLPEYLADFFDGDRTKASIATSTILATLSLLLATKITPQPKSAPAAPTTPQQKTNLRKQNYHPGSTGKDVAGLCQQKQAITSTDSQDQYVKEVALIKQTKAKVDSQHDLLVLKGNELLGKIALSQDYLGSNNCKVEARKRHAMAKSNFAKITFITVELNAHKEKITLWAEQLDQVPPSVSHLEKHSLMLQQGQTLLTNLSGFVSSLQSLDQVLAEQLQFEQKSIEAWKKKHPKVPQSQSEPPLASTSLRLG